MRTVAIWDGNLKSIPPVIVLVACLAVTLVVSIAVRFYVENENLRRLRSEVDRVRNQIESRMDRYENALMQTRAFVITSKHLDRKIYHQYVESLMLLETFPGIQGLGYTTRVHPEDLTSHVEAVRSEGFPDYDIWPKDARDEHFSILYLEPFDWRNQRAFGYDMFSESMRREAMIQARDTGLPAVSGTVKLVQETDHAVQPGFLIFVPVYKGGVTPSTVEGRRKSLSGFVYAPFRAHDLFNALFESDLMSHIDAEVNVGIYDGVGDQRRLLYDSRTLFGPESGGSGGYMEERTFKRGGRAWSLVVKPRQSFFLGTAQYAPAVFAFGGLLLSFLLYGMLASDRRHLLRESASKDTLEKVNKISKSISAELELEKLIQEVTDAATSIIGAQFGAFFYNVINSAGEAYTLYTISGVPKEAFAKFPMPRNTEVFAPTFAGTGIVRSNDITKDPRYGKNAPYRGMPEGHLPVRSYLAVPVISRSGDVLGGLFFGHKRVGVFGEREEQIVAGIASHAAVAIDNAKLYEHAKEAIRARDQFLSICSHELKTPITSLKLQAQILNRQIKKHGPVNQQQVSAFCENIDKQLNQLTRLVEDMLDVARIETGRLSINRQRIELSELAKTVAGRFNGEAKSRGVTLIVRTDVHISVDGNEDRITQVISNLISNALKYGNGKPVEVSTWIEGNRAKLAVRDRGMGIEAKDLDRIFSRFERAVSHQNISGLGLGLYISSQIAAAHSGSIHVESRVGEGSTFTLDLPLASSASMEAVRLDSGMA
ncbi:MAG: CHASE domain-containing protein [Bdellovibrionales bacterium]